MAIGKMMGVTVDDSVKILGAARTKAMGLSLESSGGGGNSFLTNLVADWDLTESSGTRSDNHTGGYDLTETGGTVSGSASGADFVPADTAYLRNTSWPTISGGVFSLSMWIDADTMNNVGIADMPSDFLWLTTSSTTLWARVEGVWSQKSITVPTTADTHLVITCDGSYIKQFVDGVLEGYTGSLSISTDMTGTFSLGTQSASRWFDGKIKRVSFWDRALTDGGETTEGNTAGGEIADLYNSGTPRAFSYYE